MINVVDLFQLFGEIAGLDVRKEVPSSHILDSEPVLPYLTNPDQESIRTSNFTQTSDNIRATGTVIPPCAIEEFKTCVQLFTQEDLEILPLYQNAIRDEDFKLVVRELQLCPETHTSREFYMINELPTDPMLDQHDLLDGKGLEGLSLLNENERRHFEALFSEMNEILNSEPDCPGDGNLDKFVNIKDIQNWEILAEDWGQSSVYDFNFDGLTSDPDLSIISQNFGSRCLN